MHRALLIFLTAFYFSTPVLAGERTVTLAVENMTCASCLYIVRKTLESVPGVIHVEVLFRQGTALVTYDDATADVAKMTALTAGLGYPSHVIEATGG